MSFAVDTAGLQGLPAQLDRLHEDALLGSAYVDHYAKLSYGGLLDKITGGHEAAVTSVRNYLDKLAGPVAGNTADAVRYAMTYYTQTDVKSAVALDDTYPQAEAKDDTDFGHHIHPSSTSAGGRFHDAAEFTDHYKTPPDHSAEFPFQPQPVMCVSPAAFGRAVIVEATELAASLGLGHRWDPYEAILKPVTGDWSGLRSCTDVFGNVGEALGDMANNVRIAAEGIHEVWTGRAAEGLTAHLIELARTLDEAREPLEKLGRSYEDAARSAFALFGALGDVLNDLIDAVLIFIAEASAAAATSETVIGGIAFGISAAYEADKVYRFVKGAVGLYTSCMAVIETIESAQHGFGAVSGEGSLPTLKETRPPLPGNQSMVGVPKLSSPAPPKVTAAK